MLIVLIKCFNVLSDFFSIKSCYPTAKRGTLSTLKSLKSILFFFSQSALNDIGLSVDRTLYSNNDLF